MKLSIICCVLLGFLIAVPLSHRSSLRVLSANESSNVRGAQFLGFYPWAKCGTTNECKANSCSDDDCSGWKTTPEDDVPNKGCNDIDWLSVCFEGFSWNILEQSPACATKGGACFQVEDPMTGSLSCQEVIGQGFVFVPTAPYSCVSQSLVDFLFPL